MNSGVRVSLICFVLIGVCSGCVSIRSIMLHRDESNLSWQKTRHLPGVPITLKVPTHLEVSVKEKHYLTTVKAGGVERVERVKLDAPIRSVSTEFIKTEKIFTVDFKRPAAGTMKLSLEMKDDEQYFEKIQHEVEDKTIEAVSGLVKNLLPSGFATASGGGSSLDNQLKEVESTVAVEVFEIDAPDFELQVSEFLRCHLNQSHDAWVVPNGVGGYSRVGVSTTGQIQPLCEGDCVSY